jgi:hypothetical protein
MVDIILNYHAIKRRRTLQTWFITGRLYMRPPVMYAKEAHQCITALNSKVRYFVRRLKNLFSLNAL